MNKTHKKLGRKSNAFLFRNSDKYFENLLKSKGTPSKEIIELKRIQILLKRETTPLLATKVKTHVKPKKPYNN